MSYPKIGDIIKVNGALPNEHFGGNQWWSRYFIYLGVNGEYIKAINIEGNIRIDMRAYYKNDFKNIAKSKHYTVVGHSKGWELLEEELKKEWLP